MQHLFSVLSWLAESVGVSHHLPDSATAEETGVSCVQIITRAISCQKLIFYPFKTVHENRLAAPALPSPSCLFFEPLEPYRGLPIIRGVAFGLTSSFVKLRDNESSCGAFAGPG